MQRDRKSKSPDIHLTSRWKVAGTLVQVLLPSIKMKGTDKGISFEKQFHDFLTSEFGGYTVASGNITGYWVQNRREEYSEHRLYQIAIAGQEDLTKLGDYLERLARRLKEKTIFCVMDGTAFFIPGRTVKENQRLPS